jgi:hypothetical protein
MKTICSMCNTVINPGTTPDERVSHGICKSCYEQILSQYGFNTKKFLDMLDAPVFLVDDDANILEANSQALAMTRKPVVQVRKKICGKVLDCINACLPEGCGKTPFCPDCTIRNSVVQTFATGTPVNGRQAMFVRNQNNTEEKVHLNISTRKEGNIVMLRLKPADA